MKNKHVFYNILMTYEIICSGILIFLCIRLASLGVEKFKVISFLIIIIQGFEIFIYVCFFYRTLKKYSLITTLMNLVVCMQLFFLGADFATKTLGKSQTPVLTLVLEILFIVYLIFCRRIRINELNQKCNTAIDKQ